MSYWCRLYSNEKYGTAMYVQKWVSILFLFFAKDNKYFPLSDGYYGDGYHCSAIQDDQDDCRTLSLCDMNAECKLNRLIGKYTCVCKASFRGDGIVCTEESESCEKMNNCGTNAECISDESSNHAYYCSCNTGWVIFPFSYFIRFIYLLVLFRFVGDGYTCIAESKF